MKNIVLFLVDSMNNSRIKSSTVDLMPFLSQLKKKGVFCDEMYSQAPYTEAANMNIYCGQDVLSNGGYLFRYLDAPTTIFEAMQKKGYVTYYNDYEPQCHPSSPRRGAEELFYSVGYEPHALWSYRLRHYSEVNNCGELNEWDYKVLEEIVGDNFREWLAFADCMIRRDKTVNMIVDNASSYDPTEIKNKVSEEYEKYNADRRKYILDILKQGKGHAFFKIQSYGQNNKIKEREAIPQIQELFRPLFKRIKKMQFKKNIKKCGKLMAYPTKRLFKFFLKPNLDRMKDFAKCYLLSKNQLFDGDLFDRIGDNLDSFKNSPSARSHIEHYLSWRSQQNTDKPHFAFFHVNDVHDPEIFFTYDSSDLDLLKKEKEDAEEVLNSLPHDFTGNITHDLSLRYIDGVIKYFYDKMGENGYLDDTYILICADHGFSFSGNPIRDSAVTNLYLENYNIPCVLTGPDLVHKQVKGLRASKDIPATLCDLADGDIPPEFIGHSILEDFEYDNLMIEYCGGGCPDLSRRQLKIAAFDNKYFVGTLATLGEEINKKNTTEVYDLQNDQGQKKNLAKKIDADKIKYLIDIITLRKEKILQSFEQIKEIR